MRLIDADKLHYVKVLIQSNDWKTKEAVVVFAKEIDKAQIVDAVPVVRCKDCKYAHMTIDGLCKYCDLTVDDYEFPIELYRDGDSFCACGERRN